MFIFFYTTQKESRILYKRWDKATVDMRGNTCGKEGREKKKAETREEVEGRGNGEKPGERGQSPLSRQVASLMMRCKQFICVEERKSRVNDMQRRAGGAAVPR